MITTVKRKRIPRRKRSFEDSILGKAMRESQSADPGFFNQIMDVLLPNNRDQLDPPSQPQEEIWAPAAKVNLVCNIQQTTGDVIESALRKKFGDKKEAREKENHNVDLIFNNTIFEVKYKREGFKGLATDSQSLRKRADKWYIYVKGEIQLDREQEHEMWITRSDKLYDAIRQEREILDVPTLEIPASYDDNTRSQLIADIQKQIHDIEYNLAVAVWNKATGDQAPVNTMGLEKRIGLNRVRFDLKFEQLIRAYVREILRS